MFVNTWYHNHSYTFRQFLDTDDQIGQTALVCDDATDCVPLDLRGQVPQSLIFCINGSCSCSDCFELFNDTCQLSKCRGYDETQRSCTDHRKSQRTAVILSALLSSAGAANFYIGRYTLGEFVHLCVCLY